MDSLATIWHSGNAIAMKDMMTSWETPEEKEYLETLFGERDVRMTEKIEELLENNQNAFVILGAGHFVNEQGIINRLTKKNTYQVIKY